MLCLFSAIIKYTAKVSLPAKHWTVQRRGNTEKTKRDFNFEVINHN